MISRRVVFIFLGLMSGCAAQPPANLESMDLGPAHDVKATMHEWFETRLFDPDSVKDFAYTLPQKCAAAPDISWKYEYGWCAGVKYNAKNRLGGYTGLTEYYVLFQDGRVRKIRPPKPDWIKLLSPITQ